MNAIGILVSNIDNASLKLNKLKMEQYFDTKASFGNKLTKIYKNQFLKLLLNIIGSVDILGNPVGLVQNLAQGFFNAFDYPIEGFILGPFEGVIGVAKGQGSLVKHTFQGIFNSVEKITSSVANGFSQLTFDTDFIQFREIQQFERPKHFIQGFQQAGLAFYYGFEKGITGIYTQYEKQNGAKGHAFGITKGMVGLLMKPVSGFFDAVSKTAEGIKNTAVQFDDGPNQRRSRPPRAFYSQKRFIKSYLNKDADWMQFLFDFRKGKFANYSLVDIFYIILDEGRDGFKYYLIVTHQAVICCHLTKKEEIKYMWYLKMNQVENIIQMEEGLKFRLNAYSKSIKGFEKIVYIKDSLMKEKIFQVVHDILQSYEN